VALRCRCTRCGSRGITCTAAPPTVCGCATPRPRACTSPTAACGWWTGTSTLGQVRQLRARPAHRRGDCGSRRSRATSPRARTARGVCPRGGRHRDRRPRHDARHGGMAPERRAGAEPGPHARRDYERVFADWLGITQTIWLGEGCVGDDTHGHVDDIARFVAPGVVVLAHEEDPADENHARSLDNLRRLEGRRGRPRRADPRRDAPVPAPGDHGWRAAAGELRELLHRNGVVTRADVQRSQRPGGAEHAGGALPGPPGRRHPRGGSRLGPRHLHCLTQQQPAAHGRRARPRDESGPGADPLRERLQAKLGAQYEIESLLGQGGMGSVYRALDRRCTAPWRSRSSAAT
jgi:hypothetical protein